MAFADSQKNSKISECPQCQSRTDISDQTKLLSTKIKSAMKYLGNMQENHDKLKENICSLKDFTSYGNPIDDEIQINLLRTESDELVNSSKMNLELLVEKMFEVKMCVDKLEKYQEIVRDDSQADPVSAIYSESLRKRIGIVISRFGPIMSLNSDACCDFETASWLKEEQETRWKKIASGEKLARLSSKLILLPDLLKGLLVLVGIWSKSPRKFKLCLVAPSDISHNLTIPLPIYLGLQVEVKLSDESWQKLPIHHYVVNQLGYAEPDNFYIPLEKLSLNTFPKIKLKFYTYSTSNSS